MSDVVPMTYPKMENLLKRDLAIPKMGYTAEHFRSKFMLQLQYAKCWWAVEKLDGMNMRVCFSREKDRFCFWGRTEKAQLPPQLVESMDELFNGRIREHPDFEEAAWLVDGTTLFGEGVGPGIQKGGSDYGSVKHFVLFDIYNTRWLDWADVKAFANHWSIPVAPDYGLDDIRSAFYLISLTPSSKYAIKSTGTRRPAEGVILRPEHEMIGS